MHRSREQEFKQELDRLTARSPYPADTKLHWIYVAGLLTRLLSYSAVDQPEVRGHVRRLLAEQANEPRPEQ